ncbi:response regulator [Marivita sp. GX14005]|uniref:response regulator n=1 Tax=Marivita sp. GX14005 TaxID=2942276 RepID=UPI00201A1FBA|nr:response regulator [Marivita sp. GX14005]MCL3883910.1 response regulator [Marivita sp. GX14005]
MELETIVHVDDDEDIRTIVQIAIETVGQMKLVQFADGPSALAGLDGPAPDLFLLDVMMPGMTGQELRTEIAKNPRFANVPTVFVTAKAEDSFTDRLRASGALAVITKPFDPMTLADTLKTIWSENRDRLDKAG